MWLNVMLLQNKKGKHHTRMCKQTYEPQDARKIPSAPRSGGESLAEVLWMKGCMDGLGMIQED